jgi:REP-associated tyrosine transposase
MRFAWCAELGDHAIRLKGYDYTQSGAYYVTIVTYQRQHFFGEVVNGEMQLNAMGQIAHDEWFKTATLRPYVELHDDEFVVMPNHVHGIIWIHKNDGGEIAAIVGARRRRAPIRKTIITFYPHDCPRLQICGNLCGQCSAKSTRRRPVATQLLRTRDP